MTEPQIHPTAIIHPDTSIGPDVAIGPYVVIGPNAEIGGGCRIAAHAVIEGHTSLGKRCEVGVGAVIGGAPQDRKFRGEPTRVEIGDDTALREYATVHRGTSATGVTRVGRRCFIMTYAHVAHDCDIEDDVVLANAVQLAGHVHIEAGAQVGGSTSIHQFVRVGTLAFVGGASRVVQDVPPYTRAAGNPMKLYGVNGVGLTRAGLPSDVRMAVKRAYRSLFNSDLSQAAALEAVRADGGASPEVARLADFVARSERGILSGTPA